MNYPEQINDHLLSLWQDSNLVTPAYVFDEVVINSKLEMLKNVNAVSNCHILYSIKALSFTGLLNFIAKQVDGFSTSSAFESRLAREILGTTGIVCMTSPGIRAVDIPEITGNCNYLSFNSISQWQQYKDDMTDIKIGLRINPGLSYVEDARYDPCREFSKLGISLDAWSELLKRQDFGKSISGFLIHNNCESEDFTQLESTVARIIDVSGDALEKLEWVNLGGGYLVKNKSQLQPLCRLVSELKTRFGLDVYFEPGKAIVGEAGYLVASVIDIYMSDGKRIAILDTSVNHLPEVFEYQYSPPILQHETLGDFEYRLAGSSCLSGDIFGDYFFENELSIGSRIIFPNVGAYMTVKASMFNGINLPTVYSLTQDSNLKLQRNFEYSDFRNRL